MRPFYETHRHCPRCGREFGPQAFDAVDVLFACARCDHRWYQNSIPSSVAVIPRRGRPAEVVMLARATPPHVGKLALPGGILRYHEPPEDGARREAREETGLDVRVDRLLLAHLVDYEYHDSLVSILELAYVTEAVDTDLRDRATAEASRIEYHDTTALLQRPDQLAFPEQHRVIACYSRSLTAAMV